MSKAEIKDIAVRAIADVLAHHGKMIDFDQLIDEARDILGPDCENAVIYYHNAQEYVNELEAEYGDQAEDYCSGLEFAPHQWRDAMQSYAMALVSSAAEEELHRVGHEVRRAQIALQAEIEALGGDVEGFDVSVGHPYGWAPHDRETAEGVCTWLALEDELTAVAHQLVPGIYGNICWAN